MCMAIGVFCVQHPSVVYLFVSGCVSDGFGQCRVVESGLGLDQASHGSVLMWSLQHGRQDSCLLVMLRLCSALGSGPEGFAGISA
jgi:hypothetical protein